MTIMIGIGPHKATDTAVAIDNKEVVLGEFTLGGSKAQARDSATRLASSRIGGGRSSQPMGREGVNNTSVLVRGLFGGG